MGKVGLTVTKYVIVAEIASDGVVERPDVIGAIFGQTEGLLGEDLELRELQKNGKIGRIEVNITSTNGKSTGKIEIPTSLSKEDTALIAAALETIERIGPCNAKIKTKGVDDVRSSKREYVIDRAKAILNGISIDLPESHELSEQIRNNTRTDDIIEYGTSKLPAGPDVEKSKEIIIVEGRADVITLLKNGVKNALGIGGTNIPDSISTVCRGKIVTAFLDGDRGGDLILKNLMQRIKVNYVTKAPIGREVEELTKKEIIKALRNKAPPTKSAKLPMSRRAPYIKRGSPPGARKPPARTPYTQAPPATRTPVPTGPEIKILGKIAASTVGTGKATLLKKQSNNNFREVGKVPMDDVLDVIRNLQGGMANALILDGMINQNIVDESFEKGIKYIVGKGQQRVLKRHASIILLDIKSFKNVKTQS